MDAAQTRITSPFTAKSTALDVVHDLSLAGRNAIVTGGAAGLGLETSRALLSAGAAVMLAVRKRAQGDAAAAQFRAEIPGAQVVVGLLDLGELASVKRFAADYLASGLALDILINNAAIMACPLTRLAHGWEAQFATNHFGHFALATRLLPALRKTAAQQGDARVVTLSSSGHKLGGIDFDDIHYARRDYHKWRAYGQAKSANALFSLGLHLREGRNGITSNAVHPGGIMTGLQKFLPMEEMRALGWLKPDDTPLDIFKNPAQGASTSVWAATAAVLKAHGGLYLEDCTSGVPAAPSNRVSGYSPHIMDQAGAERLWAASEAALGLT